MTEILTKISVKLIEKKCKYCNGVVVFTGITYDIFPPLYKHICNKCKKYSSEIKMYPAIKYKDNFYEKSKLRDIYAALNENE